MSSKVIHPLEKESKSNASLQFETIHPKFKPTVHFLKPSNVNAAKFKDSNQSVL